MFSGIIAAVGQITRITPRDDGAGTVRLTIDAGQLGLDDVGLGDSIACSGVCLTVVDRQDNCFSVDVSPESLACTVGLAALGPVNLEKALRLADRLGGHLVSGHVDGVGEVLRFEAVGDNRLLAGPRAGSARPVHRAQGLDHRRWRQPDDQLRSMAPPLPST
jgi:riboflavin synthase